MADGSLSSVIVGGAIALGGVVITSGINYLMKRAENEEVRKKARAAKFEELVETVYQYNHWLDTKQNIVVFGKDGKLEVSPLAKIEAISAVHFPKFKKPIEELALASLAFEKWMWEAAQRYRVNKSGDEITLGLNEVYRPYIAKRDALLAELKKFASEEFR